MKSGEPSQTAQMVAVLRANHYLFSPDPKLLHDDLAFHFVELAEPDDVKRYVADLVEGFSNMSNPEVAQLFVDRIETSVCIRSRLVEERIRHMRDEGLEQVVILGAGLDTTAYRCCELLDGIKVFEVDHPATQLWKKQRLAACDITIPDNVRFTSFDFEQQTLAEALEADGVNKNVKTLFPWLGVQMYLTDEAVRATLNVVGQFAKNSELIFDFTMPDYKHKGELVDNPVDQLSTVVSKMGEPFLSRYTLADLELRVNEAGFSTIKFFDGPMIVEEVLGGEGKNYKIPKGAIFLAAATV